MNPSIKRGIRVAVVYGVLYFMFPELTINGVKAIGQVVTGLSKGIGGEAVEYIKGEATSSFPSVWQIVKYYNPFQG